MQRKSALDSSEVPQVLLKATPREVRLSSSGTALLVIAAAIVCLGMWGAVESTERAEAAERHVQLFARERLVTAGEIVQLRKRGGDDDNRATVHYRYLARGTEFTGTTDLRRGERDNYAVGSPVAIWYLPSEPHASWLDGYAPRREPAWPGTVIPLAAGVAAMAMIIVVRRQWNLLAYGRPAIATVTKVEKKRSDHGSFWRVHYEWTLMSGATRTGRYNHGRKHPPAIGQKITIVHDRDNTHRHTRYPMPFVTVRQA